MSKNRYCIHKLILNTSGSLKKRATCIIYIGIILIFNSGISNAQSTSAPYAEALQDLTETLYQHLYQNKDSTYYYLREIISLADRENDAGTVASTTIDINRMATYYFDLKTLHENLQQLDSLLHTNPTYASRSRENLFYKNSMLFDQATYEYYIGNFRASRTNFQKVIERVKNLTDTLFIEGQNVLKSNAYTYIAKMYADEGKHDFAEQHYNNIIRSIIAEGNGETEFLIDNYNLLADSYKNKGDYKTSTDYFLKVWNYYPKTSEYAKSFVSAGQNIVQNYLKLKQIDSANHYLELINKHLPKDHVFQDRYYKAKGKIYESSNQYDLALLELNKSLKILKQRWTGIAHEEVASMHLEIGLLHHKYKNYNEAIKSFDHAIKEVANPYGNKSLLLKILKNKANAQNSITGNEAYLASLHSVDNAIETLNSIKPTFKSEADKIVLIEDAFPMFEAGLKASYKMYQTTSNDKYIDRAFDYSEKSKSVLLLEALLGAKANQFAAIPQSILDQENQLRTEINFIQKELNRATNSVKENENKLFALQQDLQKLITTIENEHQDYYNLKYNTQTLTLSETQQLLQKDEKLISYFYGNDAIYTIAITPNSKQIKQISLTPKLKTNIENVQQQLVNSKSDLTLFANSSYELYNTLVAPLKTTEATQKLIFISDGLLNYIPFGALNTNKNGISYLVEQYAVSYENSATLFAQLAKRSSTSGNLLAFAPAFSGQQVEIDPNRDALLPLPHNKREVDQILTSFKGTSFTGKNASLQNFTSEYANYNILHLATHAVFNDNDPEYSYLAFSNLNEQEGLLYVSDLYNMQIDANLVTLSACETGLGELKRGEGFLSLARGFFYSGASSIASTLWKVNDASATTIMSNFYSNLSEGNDKDIALQKAKLNFLNTNRKNALAHPYYWSGFVLSGNTAPVAPTINWNHIFYGIAAIVFISILFLFGRRKKSLKQHQ